jgi:hypothetical protein
MPARPEDGYRRRPDRFDRADRRRGRADQLPVPAVGDPYRRPAAGVVRRRAPGRLGPPPVLVLPLDQVGGHDVRAGPPPARAGAVPSGAAVGVGDRQLREHRRAVTPLVVRPQQADLAAVPAVGQQGAHRVPAGREQAAHVVRGHLRPGGVFGVAGEQFLVTDPSAVQPRLDDAVRGHVQPGHRHLAPHLELAAQPVRRAAPGRPGVHVRRFGPRRPPVAGAQQTGLDRQRFRPVREPGFGPHPDPHRAPLPRRQRPARPRHQHTGVRRHDRGGPGAVAQFVRRLPGAPRGQPPGQPRPRLAQAERMVQMLRAQMGGTAHPAPPGCEPFRPRVLAAHRFGAVGHASSTPRRRPARNAAIGMPAITAAAGPAHRMTTVNR